MLVVIAAATVLTKSFRLSQLDHRGARTSVSYVAKLFAARRHHNVQTRLGLLGYVCMSLLRTSRLQGVSVGGDELKNSSGVRMVVDVVHNLSCPTRLTKLGLVVSAA